MCSKTFMQSRPIALLHIEDLAQKERVPQVVIGGENIGEILSGNFGLSGLFHGHPEEVDLAHIQENYI